MHPKRKQRLWMVLAIVLSATAACGLLFYALSDNLNLFYPPSEIVQGKAPVGQRIRAGGMVKAGSVIRQADGLTVEFIVTDYEADVTVRYTGILPDLFAENDGVVVAGMLDEMGVMQADEVLAKHDENYMPPEVADSLKNPMKANKAAPPAVPAKTWQGK
ncbi:MAG: cytochrome c maturation protein CcmE [Pseudomonadales bacterium]|nr:cytochrome c maturation protein CcmE [Pseudomonadales bacterium]